MKPSRIAEDCRLVDEELDRRFAEPSAPLSEPVRRHLENCERCRKLNNWIESGSSVSECSPDFYAKVQSNLTASLKPVSARPSLWVIACQFGVLFLLLTFGAIKVLGLGGFEKMTASQIIGATIALSFGSILLSICLTWQIIPGSLRRISPGVLFATVAAGFVASVVVLFPWRTPEPFFARGWPCLGIGLGTALLAGLLFWLLGRRGTPLDIVQIGGTLGAIAGLVGVSVLQFTCDRQEAEHLLFWHGGVLFVSAAAGVLIALLLQHFVRRTA